MAYSRRKFVSFLGKASLGTMIIPPFLMGCGNNSKPINLDALSDEELIRLKQVLLKGLTASDQDDLLLSDGLDYHVVVKWGDYINEADTFGFNNDFTCFIPLDDNNPKDGLLWVNHEYINPLYVSDFNFRAFDKPQDHRTLEQVNKEMYNVGGIGCKCVMCPSNLNLWHLR